MIGIQVTVPAGQTSSAWVDVGALFAQRVGGSDRNVCSLAALVFPAGYAQASATIEVAEDGNGAGAGALYDIDGVTNLSLVKMPATGLRASLAPQTFCYVPFVNVTIPAVQGTDAVFTIGLRRAD